MSFFKGLKAFFDRAGPQFIDPTPPLAFRRGRHSLPVQFPSAFTTPEQKLLYTLWKEGSQPYTNLPFLTGLPLEDIESALKRLERRNYIEKYDPAENRRHHHVPPISLARNISYSAIAQGEILELSPNR